MPCYAIFSLLVEGRHCACFDMPSGRHIIDILPSMSHALLMLAIFRRCLRVAAVTLRRRCCRFSPVAAIDSFAATLMPAILIIGNAADDIAAPLFSAADSYAMLSMPLSIFETLFAAGAPLALRSHSIVTPPDTDAATIRLLLL